MMFVILLIVCAFSQLVVFLIGHALGVNKERREWNNLIEKGILPAPRFESETY